MKSRVLAVLGCAAIAFAALGATSTSAQSAKFQSYKILKTYPHDSACFTQGLQWIGSSFLESCGQTGQSNVREVNLSGKIMRQKALPKEIFAEGLVRLGSRVYQLTWQQGYGLLHDVNGFKDLGKFTYPKPITEGWGLTTDGKSLILSDGSSKLYWLDPKTFAVQRSVNVKNGDSEVNQLNELEWIGGEVWANVWMTDLVARIDGKTGRINSWVNFAGLRPDSSLSDADAVLNGIAYDVATKRVFVTGKRWDKLFEVAIQ
jgi:glutaminyl-peptide cyclotransferase